jgi:FkbM family methyltransferase
MSSESSPAPWGSFPMPDALSGPVSWCRRMPANWFGQRLALALRHHAKRTCVGPLDVEALGVRLRLHPEDNFCENRLLFMPQYYDPQEFAFLGRVLGPTSCFVDIGANVGIYSLMAAKRCAPLGRVLAVEPDPVTFSRLVTNLALNDLAQVQARQLAVGARPGVLHLHRHARNRGQNELRADGSGTTETVAVQTLAALLADADCEAPDVMKMDIEGMEEEVLKVFFAEAPTASRPVHLIIEEKAGAPRASLRAQLTAAGYRKVEQTRTNGIWRLA